MDQLVWLIALAAVLFGLHAAVVIYLYRSAATDSTSQSADKESPDRERAVHHDHGDEPGLVSCPTCATPNDPSFRFCRSCVGDLTSRSSATDDPGGTDRLGN